MSNSIIMGANILAFMPVSSAEDKLHDDNAAEPEVEFDAEAWKSELRTELHAELRAELNAEYEERLASELAARESDVEARFLRELELKSGEFDLKTQELEAETRELESQFKVERENFDQMLSQCNENFNGCITALRKEIQKKVIDLSLSLAEVIVRHELPDRDMLHNLVVKTLDPVSDLQGVVVRISSHDWELFGEKVTAGERLGVGGTVKFAEDPNLSSGDVIVESRNGIFDARLDERLKLLKEMLHERSGRALPESS